MSHTPRRNPRSARVRELSGHDASSVPSIQGGKETSHVRAGVDVARLGMGLCVFIGLLGGSATGSMASASLQGTPGPVDLLTQECTAGALESCGLLGERYERGNGVDKDHSRAAALYEKACEGGVARSCGALGALYSQGKGVPEDVIRAARALREGVRRGSGRGLPRPRRALRKGPGSPRERGPGRRALCEGVRGRSGRGLWCPWRAPQRGPRSPQGRGPRRRLV